MCYILSSLQVSNESFNFDYEKRMKEKGHLKENRKNDKKKWQEERGEAITLYIRLLESSSVER